jgi:hypothetical protein
VDQYLEAVKGKETETLQIELLGFFMVIAALQELLELLVVEEVMVILQQHTRVGS